MTIITMLWMHCASVGEFEQGRPVLESFERDTQNGKCPNLLLMDTFNIRNWAGADLVLALP